MDASLYARPEGAIVLIQLSSVSHDRRLTSIFDINSCRSFLARPSSPVLTRERTTGLGPIGHCASQRASGPMAGLLFRGELRRANFLLFLFVSEPLYRDSKN